MDFCNEWSRKNDIMGHVLDVEQSVPLCCFFAALGGALEVAATAVTAIPAVRELEGIEMNRWMRWLSVLGNLTLAGIGSIFGHLIATWFGPVSIVIPYFFSSTLLCNMAIVGLLREQFNKNMRVGTLVIVVAVILLPIVGPTTQDGQNFEVLMTKWYAQVWLLVLLAVATITAIFLALDITKYDDTGRTVILLLARASSLCVNVTVSRSFILGPTGIFLGVLVVIKLASGSLYSTAIVIQSFAVNQSTFVPLNATMIMLVNALTGIIIWEEYRCVQSWLGYMCVFALLGLGCDLLLSVSIFTSENPNYGLKNRVSSIGPGHISTLHIPGKLGYEPVPEGNEIDEENDEIRGSLCNRLESTTLTTSPRKLERRRKSRVDAWREIVSPISTTERHSYIQCDGSGVRSVLFHSGQADDDELQPGSLDIAISRFSSWIPSKQVGPGASQTTTQRENSVYPSAANYVAAGSQMLANQAKESLPNFGEKFMAANSRLGETIGAGFQQVGSTLAEKFQLQGTKK
jgi:hypothetical protein